MRKFKIEKQQLCYAHNETNLPKINAIEVEADDYKLVKDSVLITEINLEIAQTINSNYKVGETHYGPLKCVEFYVKEIDSNEPILLKSFNVFADPYYKLFEEINGEWLEIDKHTCS